MSEVAVCSTHFKVLIIGAGSGGLSLSARLCKRLGSGIVGLIEPSDVHDYQPLWTLVGAGLVKKEKTRKPLAALIPKGVSWLRDRVTAIHPASKNVECAAHGRVTYDLLVVATGLQLDFQKIKGLDDHLGKNGICSIYQYGEAEKTAQMLQNFRGGRAIFTMPPVPIKCAGAPQKIMYLADEIFRKNGVRGQSEVVFMVAGKVIFGVPEFAKPLNEIVEKKKIDVRYGYQLVEVKPSEKIAVFQKTAEASSGQVLVERVEFSYDLLHVVPPMSAHALISDSGLAFTSGPQTGWLKVDMQTLQHLDYPEIFGVGDVTGIPNSKTGAAIRKQAPVIAQNIIDVLGGRTPSAQYDGYSSCPLITGFGKVILAEFGYNGKLMPTFPMDMTKERKSMWILKKNLLPSLYWRGMLRGRF